MCFCAGRASLLWLLFFDHERHASKANSAFLNKEKEGNVFRCKYKVRFIRMIERNKRKFFVNKKKKNAKRGAVVGIFPGLQNWSSREVKTTLYTVVNIKKETLTDVIDKDRSCSSINIYKIDNKKDTVVSVDRSRPAHWLL